jgi:hypothetical protein
LNWKSPDDLELVAECETLPEAEVVRGLLASGDIVSTIVSVSDSTILFAQRSVFGRSAQPVPYKVLVRPEDSEAARELLAARAEELPDGD